MIEKSTELQDLSASNKQHTSLDVSPDAVETSELNENLLDFNNEMNSIKRPKPSTFQNILYTVIPCIKKVDTTSKRYVFFRERENNITNFSNKEENHKYNLISFIPVVIFNQFKQFGNLFYLIMSVTQFIPQLKVGFLIAYISPLAIVVSVSMIKELYDDINRRIQDNKTNSAKVKVYEIDKNLQVKAKTITKTAAELNIGDIVEIKKNERIPADMIILKTINEDGDNHAFIRTDQLDGETDWKLRKAPGLTQEKNEISLLQLNGFAEYEPPSKLIYNFEGVIKTRDESNVIKKEALNLENTIWASTVLASQGLIGMVIYTGKETRARMNSSSPKIKFGVLDEELNRANKYLFIIMLILSLIITLFKGFSSNIVFTFVKFIILFCSIIPISLRVNLDVSKTWFSLMINREKDIEDTIARNSTIPEELGRISYIFSDKTGTLTKNEMIFKKISMEAKEYGEENFDEISENLTVDCNNADAPMMDIINKNLVGNDGEKVEAGEEAGSLMSEASSLISTKSHSIKRVKRNQIKLLRDSVSAMVLCNNVTPITDEKNPEIITYQASSPDEIALVKFAESLKMKLFYRTDKEIKIKNCKNVLEEYEILANFPFSSDTKRMGILLKNKAHGHIIFYLKGAENVMMRFVKNEYTGIIKEKAENLALKGLRTLVLTQRLVPVEEYEKWNATYNDALTSMENRKEKISSAVSQLEKSMEFLCVTGVEDLLQDDVSQTIENLRNAGIHIWMLTGDKVETATCISISAGIKSKNQNIYTLKYDDLKHESVEEDVEKIKESLNEYGKQDINNPPLFIIDGDCLDLALKRCEKEFFENSMKSSSVVCCRCSPTQKRIIVKTIKKYTDKRTCSVGDGGNDVAMIQEADVGIGIVGKEGLQASLAADYSILKFKNLNILLLWWGRLAYKNTSTLSNFIIHRGLIISLIQFIFSMMFYYNAVALYNGYLTIGYSTLFTSFTSISILLDQDTDKETVIKFPPLYKSLLKGRELNLKSFLWWFFKSIYQSSIIMFCSLSFFEENLFLKIVTVTYTALIYLEILNVYTEIRKFHIFMIISFIGTAIIYTITIFIFSNYLDIYFIANWSIMWRIFVISLLAWIPFFVAGKVNRYCFPQTTDKLKKAQSIETQNDVNVKKKKFLGLF